jgi:Relaxase/Mobilisation nuclease domain
MIPRIHKTTSPSKLIEYLLQPTKEARVVESSVFTPLINKLIASEDVILDPAIRSVASNELNHALTRINELNPRLKYNTMHLIIGFDPQDGELSPEFKGQIAREAMEKLGFEDTYWVAISHGRDDPEHSHVHGHDHMHILAARVNTNGKTISDSHDFARAKKVLRNIEQQYEMTPFVPFLEREYVTPEVHWILYPHLEQETLEQQTKPNFSR